MKRINNLFFIIIVLLFSTCNDDFLNREPLDQISPQNFFNSEEELETYVNSLYTYLPGYSEIIRRDFQSDNVEQKTLNTVVAGQHTVPTDASEAGWTWDYLRQVNFFLENYSKEEGIPQEAKKHFGGVAKFFRAWFYFNKVKRFGDVPWYSKPLEPDNEGLYKARDPRKKITDSVLADLNFATENIRSSTPGNKIDKWSALALKARFCLHEGTFRKYHELGDATMYLEEARNAAKAIIDEGQFDLYSTGDPMHDYRDLFIARDYIAEEVILANVYNDELRERHTSNYTFISTTYGAPGLTKSFVNSYLTKDGKRFTSLEGHDTLTFYEETQNRDPRLTQTMRTPGYTRINGQDTLIPNFDNARTGYQIIKWVTGPSEDGWMNNTFDIPIFRYAEILLIYAEAKAELGEVTQEDLDITINKIRDRVEMPHITLAGLEPDPVLESRYPNVDGSQKAAIMEIRRERRIEMIMEGLRYQDLMRWKSGPLLARTFEGMYFDKTGMIDLDKNGTNDVAIVESIPDKQESGVQYLTLGNVFTLENGDYGNAIVHDVNKVFDENKHYYFPLPRTELELNDKLTQNPGW